jgi:hypothetical protein
MSNADTIWDKDKLKRYLSIYYSETVDWDDQLSKLWKQSRGNQKSYKEKIAYTIISPVRDKTRPTDPEEALLFVCFKFSNFNEADWVNLLEEEYTKDVEIEAFREVLLDFGGIHPVEYHPKSRQALQWLCERATLDKSIKPEDNALITNKLKNLIIIYGPSAVNSLFQKEELKYKYIKGAPNMRTGYFIEKALHEVYSQDKLKELKYKDMTRAPEELIVKFNTTEDTE